uniref:Uncharacterized protein n=1 Tax=Hyaloperonospora arabidopsidis (strain Emoy2) TaxID=559515 RepID=M4BAT5_HYAAE
MTSMHMILSPERIKRDLNMPELRWIAVVFFLQRTEAPKDGPQTSIHSKSRISAA